ncbi:CAP domain-containing protein [Halobacillus yeomjeoni]|uniref:Sporulation protein n=1 Tax=Halobacillus yeomjeoni TaxID=311194 RepID=A0A931MVB0_9BACI|nr:CAP domain-containing protein [Halobacillus yeomjeoni]MBH0230400.1 sporulation protein [Halobacillus yeomjeoni]
MIKKFIVLIITIGAAIYLWNGTDAKKWMESPADQFQQFTQQIQTWMDKNDIDHTSPLLERLKQYFNTGEIPLIELEKEGVEVPADSKSTGSNDKVGKNDKEMSIEEDSLSDYEQEVVALVNEERSQEGLAPLEAHERLSGLARLKSRDMAEHGYFSHTSPNYGSPFEMMNQYDFEYRAAGENIAAGQRTPEEVVEGWMNSEGHRENILNKNFTHIGIGYIEDSGSYGTYWTQLFMTPR